MLKSPRRFLVGVVAYAVICLAAVTVIVVRGEGPRPRVLATIPRTGDLYWPGGTAEITFSQDMDHASVERALQVTPGSQGQGAWFGTTLNLQPFGDWKPNVTYHVSLTGNVTDTEGRTLRTPVRFVFRVHHVGKLVLCPVHGVTNVCEPVGGHTRALTRASTPVVSYALSPDGVTLVYVHRDRSGLPHLFVIGVDGTGGTQLTRGVQYADASPRFAPGDASSVTYTRRRVARSSSAPALGAPEIWNINIDGTHNARLS